MPELEKALAQKRRPNTAIKIKKKKKKTNLGLTVLFLYRYIRSFFPVLNNNNSNQLYDKDAL